MSIVGHARALAGEFRKNTSRWVLGHRVRARNPSLICDPSAVWDYPYGDLDCIRIGRDASVGPFAEIIVRRRTTYSSIEGGLTLGDKAVLSTGANIRAAGGEIRIGAGSGIGQYVVIVAANHMMTPGEKRIHTPWDETRCHVLIGDNVWVGSGSVLLPGTRIGDNAVIGAGSVVGGEVPEGELWAGVPARRIKSLENPASAISADVNKGSAS